MLRLYASSFRSRLITARTFFTFTGNSQNTVVVDTDGTQRQVLYTGPISGLVRKTKLASVLSAGTSVIAAPLIIKYFGSDTWSFVSNFFFCSGITAASAGQMWATDHVLKSYVIRAFQLKNRGSPDEQSLSQDQLIEFETLDWLGRPCRRALFVRDLYLSGDGELTSKTTGDKFTFCPSICRTSPVLSEMFSKK